MRRLFISIRWVFSHFRSWGARFVRGVVSKQCLLLIKYEWYWAQTTLSLKLNVCRKWPNLGIKCMLCVIHAMSQVNWKYWAKFNILKNPMKKKHEIVLITSSLALLLFNCNPNMYICKCELYSDNTLLTFSGNKIDYEQICAVYDKIQNIVFFRACHTKQKAILKQERSKNCTKSIGVL